MTVQMSTPRRNVRRMCRMIAFAVAVLLVVVGAVICMLPSVIVGCEGGFFSKQVYSAHSPDGRSRLIINKRAAFPANEFIDPAIVVTMEVRDGHTGRLLDSTQVELIEDSNLRDPVVEWTKAAVRISDIDIDEGDHSRIVILRSAEQGAPSDAQ